MITTEDKVRPAEVKSTTYLMYQTFPFTVSLFGESHDLDVVIIYEEENEEYDLIGIKIDENSTSHFGRSSDVGEAIHTMIGDWFDDLFGIEHPKPEDEEICKNIEEVFTHVWDFMTDKGMA